MKKTLLKNRGAHKIPQDDGLYWTQKLYHIPHLHKLVRETTTQCDVPARVNPGESKSSQAGIRLRDTFSEWVKAFPAKTKPTLNLVPRFGLPLTLGSDNGPAFIAQVSQGLAKALGIS
ncbi:Gag-Pol polyprotein [Plecturocebus cupreus]